MNCENQLRFSMAFLSFRKIENENLMNDFPDYLSSIQKIILIKGLESRENQFLDQISGN
jgi:hypothetical protein